MRFPAILLAAGMLAACNAAHPLDGLNRSGTAAAGGHAFRVNWNLEAAQATRTNTTWRPSLAEVVPAAMAATEQVTGCRVKPATAGGTWRWCGWRWIAGGEGVATPRADEAAAIKTVTGCRVRLERKDAALVRAYLDCGR